MQSRDIAIVVMLTILGLTSSYFLFIFKSGVGLHPVLPDTWTYILVLLVGLNVGLCTTLVFRKKSRLLGLPLIFFQIGVLWFLHSYTGKIELAIITLIGMLISVLAAMRVINEKIPINVSKVILSILVLSIPCYIWLNMDQDFVNPALGAVMGATSIATGLVVLKGY